MRGNIVAKKPAAVSCGNQTELQSFVVPNVEAERATVEAVKSEAMLLQASKQASKCQIQFSDLNEAIQAR